jgi:hypothetical protein
MSVTSSSLLCNTPRILAIILVVLISNSAWSSQPWKEKKYQDWDEKDVQKILNDSPWAKLVTRTGLEAPEGPSEDATGVDLLGTHSKEAQSGDTQQTRFIVRWVSSRTVREASARALVLQKRISAEAINEHLQPAGDDFVLAIVGPDMGRFQHVVPSVLQSKSYLAAESNKKISPTSVNIMSLKDGTIGALLFHFPRTTSTGPLLSGREKSVRFSERGGDVSMDVIFEPRKMTDQSGADF